ncbi:MAG: hypothetical protein LBO67_06965 [Spirochaetaceae bacterium]|jgi:hypothetical protein|nr:hypothetical protein [Spirochaetaceae bacterium]
MIDATYSKVHADGCGAVGGNQAIGRTKGGSIPKFTLVLIRGENQYVS